MTTIDVNKRPRRFKLEWVDPIPTKDINHYYDHRDELKALCFRNKQLIIDRWSKRMAENVVLIGDVIKFPDGKRHRIAVRHYDNYQSCKIDHGGFCMMSGGKSTMSGCPELDKIPVGHLAHWHQLEMAKFWFFSEGNIKAHNGVWFKVPVRVWEYTGTYPIPKS